MSTSDQTTTEIDLPTRADDKRRARLNCINHILTQFEYGDVVPDPVELPDREDINYLRPPIHEQTFVPLQY